jgi:hypothetical protein
MNVLELIGFLTANCIIFYSTCRHLVVTESVTAFCHHNKKKNNPSPSKAFFNFGSIVVVFLNDRCQKKVPYRLLLYFVYNFIM